jgi:hypothetical protein
MRSAWRIVLVGLLLAIGPEVAPKVAAQPAPQRIISDTPEYCFRLFDRLSELLRAMHMPPPADVIFLSSEGQRMCDHGQTRGGIMRLRRALMLLAQHNAAP